MDVTESPYYRELSKDDAIDATRFLKAPSDFFELLDLDLDDADVWASRDEAMVQSIVQTAFKKKLKISHPDVLTSKYADISEEETNGFAVILNAAYKTLSDRQTREPYLLAVIDFRKHFFLSEETKFDGTPVSQMERRGRRNASGICGRKRVHRVRKLCTICSKDIQHGRR